MLIRGHCNLLTLLCHRTDLKNKNSMPGWGGYRILKNGVRDTDQNFFKIKVLGISGILRPGQRVILSHLST